MRYPFPAYRHYGKSFDYIYEQIRNSKAFAFLISSMFTPYHEETERIIAMIRKSKGSVPIIAGGAHASLYPSDLLNKGVDFVIKGEGELAVLALLRAIEEQGMIYEIPGLVYRKEAQIYTNKVQQADNIDSFVPQRNLLTKSDIKFGKKSIISFLSSRGCTNNCAFCSGRILWKGRRTRSIESIENELQSISFEYSNPIINFEDENIFADYDQASELLELLARYHIKYGFEYTAMNGVSIEHMDTALVDKMNQSGFYEINLSLMSESESLQQKYSRPFDTCKFLEIAQRAVRLSMKVRAYFILGLPGQDESSIDRTIAFLEKCNIDYYPSVFYNVFDKPENWKMQRSSAFFNQTDISREILIRYFNLCLIKMNERQQLRRTC